MVVRVKQISTIISSISIFFVAIHFLVYFHIFRKLLTAKSCSEVKGTNFSLFDDLLYWAFDHLFEVDLVQNIGLFVVVDFSLEVTQIFAVSQYIFQYENLEV